MRKKSHNVQHKQKPSRKKKKNLVEEITEQKGFFLARDFKKPRPGGFQVWRPSNI